MRSSISATPVPILSRRRRRCTTSGRRLPTRRAQHKLKAILIELSYTSDRPDAQLFGHLTPKWIMTSLHELDALAGGNALKDLPVVITHIKYALTREQPQARMRDELTAANDLGVRILIPQQGSRWHFR